MTAQTTAQTISAAKTVIAKNLVQVLLNANMTQTELAERTGRNRTVVQRMCDWDRPETITVADLLLASVPDEVVIPLINYILEARGYSPPAKKSKGEVFEDNLAYMADLIKISGEVGAEWASSISDGVWAPSQVRRFIELSRQLRAHLVTGEEHIKAFLPSDDALRQPDVTIPPRRFSRAS